METTSTHTPEVTSLAKRIVVGIVNNVWENLGEDVRDHMVTEWEEIAAREISAAGEIEALYRELGENGGG